MNSTEKTIIKILMLEDQEDDADLIRRTLRKADISFESLRVDDKENFEKALADFKPDAILSDHALPQFNSIEAIKIKQKIAPSTPFILVTGAVSDEFAAQCIKLGADDYLLKSNLSRLPASLKTALEHKTLERLRTEGEAALRQQNEQLNKANKEIDSFVYSVSHNLRSPLSSILGLIAIARQDMKKGVIETAHYFDMIEKSAQKLDETIKEILDYSQNGRIDVKVEPIELKTLIDDCLMRLQYLKGFEHINKQINIKDSTPLYSDRFRLTVILMNLFSNAIKYQDEFKDHKLLRIKATITQEQAILEITDNGIGILPDRHELIFKMFYRGTEKSDGAGLGLYIVREVVDKLGGTIQLVSEPNLLTTFIVTLPNNTKSHLRPLA